MIDAHDAGAASTFKCSYIRPAMVPFSDGAVRNRCKRVLCERINACAGMSPEKAHRVL